LLSSFFIKFHRAHLLGDRDVAVKGARGAETGGAQLDQRRLPDQ
jgi:hypothetical protein